MMIMPPVAPLADPPPAGVPLPVVVVGGAPGAGHPMPRGYQVGPAPDMAGFAWVVAESGNIANPAKVGTTMNPTMEAVIHGDVALQPLGGLVVVLRRVAMSAMPTYGEDLLRKLTAEKSALAQPGGLAAYLAGGAVAAGPAVSGGAIAPASADARVCPVRFDERGERYRQYSDAVPLLLEPAWHDWPIKGPRTTRWLAKYIKDMGITPKLRTARFLLDAKVPDTDRVKHEHATLMEILEWAMVYDQLDVSALSCFELLSRRVQLLEEAYAANPKAPRFDGGEYFQGLGRRNAAVDPALTQYVAQQLQSDAMIQKERRKAREEAALAAKPGK
jgi:hypothetical protein